MNPMRKIEIVDKKGSYVVHNDVFFVKSCRDHIVWTSTVNDALIFPSAIEADLCVEKINRFLNSNV